MSTHPMVFWISEPLITHYNDKFPETRPFLPLGSDILQLIQPANYKMFLPRAYWFVKMTSTFFALIRFKTLEWQLPEGSKAAFISQTENPDNIRVSFDDYIGNVALLYAVRIHDGLHNVVWQIIMVSKKLLDTFRQATADMLKVRVVVLIDDARVKGHVVNDLIHFEPAYFII